MTRLILPSAAISLALGLGLAALAVIDLSPMWGALLVVALVFVVVLAWHPDWCRLFMHGFLFTLPMYISKGLIAEHGVSAPGMYLLLSDIFLAGFVLTWLARKVKAREWPRFDRANQLGAVFSLLMWFSAFYSLDVWAGVFAAIFYSKYVVSFIVLRDFLDSRERLRGALSVLAYGLAFQIVIGLLQVVNRGAFNIQGVTVATVQTTLSFEGAGGLSQFRAMGLMAHPLAFAAYLLLNLPVLFGLALGRWRLAVSIRWRVMALLILGGLSLILTLSRSSWISFAAASGWFLFVAWRHKLVSSGQITSFISSSLIVAAMLAVFYPAVYLRMVEDDGGSALSRWILLDQAMLIIKDAPLLGVGLGGYVLAAQNVTPESFASIPEEHEKILRKSVVHNKYMSMAAEHGLIVMLFIVWLHCRFVGSALSVRNWYDPLEQTVAFGLAAAIVGYMVQYLFDEFYLGIPMHLIWVAFALLGSIVALQKDSPCKKESRAVL